MRYLSVCSGIEAATVAWKPLGWKAAGFAEIDKFPSAVLDHHYPNVQNYVDLTKYAEWPELQIDVLVGGTPCQDLSVAGKRAGLAGERSGLFHDFVACADRYKPRYIVWENVPGALSSNDGKDIQEVLDAFTQIGYACDIDIHDAQHFGLAQRRRRVFVVCVRLDDFLSKKTPISERIAGELLLQPLVDTWAAILQAWCPGRLFSGYESPIEQSASSALRRIELLEKALGGSACTRLLSALDASQAPVTGERENSGLSSALPCERQTAALKTDIGGYPSWSTGGAFGDKNTDTSWNSILDALSDLKSASITSTSIPATTALEISTFAEQSLRIARSITDLRSCSDQPGWSSDYWNLASLLLTLLEAITAYARHSSEDLFSEPALRDNWGDYIERARILACKSHRNLGSEPSPTTLFSVPKSLSWNPPPRREARKDIAPTISARTKGGGGLGTDFDCDGGLIQHCADIAPTLNAHFGTKQGLEDQHINGGEGFDASEDGTGRGTPHAVAFHENQRGELTTNETSGSLKVGGGKPGQGYPAVLVKGNITNCHAPEARSVEALRALREAVDEEAFSEWITGIVAAFWPQEVLQSGMHGGRFRQSPQPKRGLVNVALSRQKAGSSWSVQDLWQAGCDGCPPQGWQPSEQLAQELGAALSKLPYAPSPAERFLQTMWPACEGSRLLRETLSALEKARRSTCGKNKSKANVPLREASGCAGDVRTTLHASQTVRRLVVEECEALQGFPRGYTLIPYRNGWAGDGPRYKALGNSMAVPVMHWIGKRIDRVNSLLSTSPATGGNND